jgi:hypothetical protein
MRCERDSRPVGHALCKPGVVAVEKRRRVGNQAMDLNESAHDVCPGVSITGSGGKPKRWIQSASAVSLDSARASAR